MAYGLLQTRRNKRPDNKLMNILQTDNRLGPWLPASPSRAADSFVFPPPGAAPACCLVEFCVGLPSLPYLADHGFHDLVVLPGAFHIELARRIHLELFHRDAVSLRHIEFEHPVILNEDDVAITVRVEKREDGRISYELFDAASEVVRQSPALQPCARLLVDMDPAASADANISLPFNPNEFLRRSGPLGTADDFYRELRRNGNQYGPSFQTLAGVRRSDTQAAGRFADADISAGGGLLSPPLLDAASQLLSAFTRERGQTFILKSIDRLVVNSLGGPEPCWAHASRTDANEAGHPELVGSVQVIAADGTRLWELSGVTLAFIDRPSAGDTIPSEDTRLCVASTFTAEPLEESLRFWGEQFGRTVRLDFAPYNQVFQQLLDPASAFRRNRNGINSIVLGLEDWLHEDRRSLQPASPARAAASFGARPRTHLPNGLEIVHLNQYETDYVYQEIFEDQSYLRHGIQLADGDTVIDIGANIGLFSLFVMSQCQNPAIYAYEPSPRVFDLLQANCAAYGDSARVRAFNCGVADKKGKAGFTFYENSSVFSSFHPDKREDRAAVQAVVRNVLQNELVEIGGMHEADVLELTTDRLRAETIECPLTSVSDIIRENGLNRIHLLKIDAEKSEMEILRGIAEDHWPMIDQIVMEVHDRTRSAVRSIEEQLTRRGFHCAVVEEKLLEDSGLFNIYATRRAPAAAVVNVAAEGLRRKVDEFCAALDTFVESASAPLILAIAPRSSSVADASAQEALDAAENRVIARAGRHHQVRSIGSQAILAGYRVRHLHDPHSRQLGHMPYTPDGYAAIGTALSRAIYNLGKPPVKVIVLDCDNTLWQGLCGEDGATGVAVTPSFRHLQEFMIRQTQAGALLALCSKNQEADVLAVFDQRADMPLRREHLAGWRINWEPKPDNLRALAAQFNLGLDSFVFIDDNPVECAAVRSGCPETVVLQLPPESDRIPTFLDNLWIFDRAAATSEDRERSQWYKTNSERDAQRAVAPTLQDFLDGLQLRIDVTEAAAEQLERVSQLTVRTNQFNLTTIRRSEGEIRELLRSGATCLVTSVSDRFGDYGLVGAILYTNGADRYAVDTLLLSCRALGKGVEHRMVAELASRALRDGKSLIELPYRSTDRNEPAREFIERLGPAGIAANGGSLTLELSASALSELRYAPDDQTAETAGPGKSSAPLKRSGFGGTNLSATMQRLGDELNTIEAVVTAIESARRQAEPMTTLTGPELAEDASALEQLLAAIWKKALGRPYIGSNENFFDAGGTSLKAVVVIAMIRKELKRDVSVITLFECPTIKLLAARLDDSAGAGAGASAAAANAESRGRQRRNKLVKRRTA
jgi:FkbH-like protein/FkbM family methyltransferase